jgi:hypothetical protein
MRVNLTFELPDPAVLARAGASSSAPFAATSIEGASRARNVAPLCADRIERSASSAANGTPLAAIMDALASAAGGLPARASGHAVRYVHHGSLRVPANAEVDFAQATHYLSRDSVMRGVIARVERSHTQYTLRIVHNDNDRYVPWTHTIEWDPHSAMRTTTGGRQTPALGLGHELDHAAEPARLRDAGEVKRLPRFDNAEERRVILGSETHAARTLGEGARTNHSGRCYRVPSPVVC